jgi:plastocyanin
MRKAIVLSISVALVVLALPSASADRDGRVKPRRGKTVVVNAAAGATPITWAWDPEEITIREGDTVRWTNPTGTSHVMNPLPATAQSSPWWSEQDLPPGDSVNFRFTEPGRYKFGCAITPHSDCWYLGTDECECVGMCGVISVKP